jgi:transposase
MEISTIGLDLAKNVFQVHGISATGEVVIRKALRRSQMLPFFQKLPPCLVGAEACGTSHHWARELTRLGHEVRLMPAAYVKPYVKRGKNDAAEAANVAGILAGQLLQLHIQLRKLDLRLAALQRSDDRARRLATIPGIGPIGATALAASVTDPGQFSSGRQFAAWLGLTPRQSSSGGKERLGRITKMGDRYLRALLVVGATALVRYAKQKPETVDPRFVALLARKPARVASVAIANKMARIAWAVMARGGVFERGHAPMLAAVDHELS